VTKDKDGQIYQQHVGDASFVPMLTGKNN